MAGEWIAYDLALPDKPEVQELIDLTGEPVEAVVAQWRWRRRGPAFVKLADGPAGKVRYERREVERWMKDPVSYQARRMK